MRRRFWPRLRRHFTAGGRVLLAASSFSLLAGLDPFRTQLGGLFVLAASFMLANFLVGFFTRVRLGGQFVLPPRAAVHSMVCARVELTNLSRQTGYEIEATLPIVLTGLGPGHESQRIDRLEPGQSAQVEVFFAARRRGSYSIGPIYAGSTYPLGILRLGNFLGNPQTLLVTPAIHPMRSLNLNSGMRYQPGGLPQASHTGESLEFVGVRDYQAGDSLRKIHWKLWARHLSSNPQALPVVREFSQEYFSRIGIILDTYRPPTPAHFEAAVEVVASVANFLARQDAIVDFFAAGPELHLLSMGRNLGTLERVLEVLACVQPQAPQKNAPAPYEELAPRLQQLLPRLSALLLVTFHPDDQRRAFIQRLRMGGAPLRILIIGTAQEGGDGVSYIAPDQVAAGLEQL
jgi:uncharacterized protein (DUF58 family)